MSEEVAKRSRTGAIWVALWIVLALLGEGVMRLGPMLLALVAAVEAFILLTNINKPEKEGAAGATSMGWKPKKERSYGKVIAITIWHQVVISLTVPMLLFVFAYLVLGQLHLVPEMAARAEDTLLQTSFRAGLHALFVLAAVVIALEKNIEGSIRGASIILFSSGVLLIGGTFYLLKLAGVVAVLHFGVENAHFAWMLLMVVSLQWVSDTGAYFVGKKWGQHKIWPSVSPKKSWEGFAGGTALAMVVGLIYSVVLPSTENLTLQWILSGLVVGVFGTMGDLLQSKVKRLANAKDSSNILPGHGGIWDRIDGLVFIGLPLYFVWGLPL